MIECKLCNKLMKQITNTHLKKAHNITTVEYREMFPEVESLQSSETLKKVSDVGIRPARSKPICLKPDCDKIVANHNNKYCSTSCRSKHLTDLGIFTVTQKGSVNPNFGKSKEEKNE